MRRNKKSGIYQILNLVNQKCCIGSSKDITDRWGDHRWNLRRGTHNNKHLQNSWNKHGENNFIFRILELTEDNSKNNLEQLEDKWIDFYDSTNEEKGYNKQSAKQGIFSQKWANKQREYRSKRKDESYYLNRKYFDNIKEETRSKIISNILKYTNTNHDIKIKRNISTLIISISKEDFKRIVYLQIEPYKVLTEEEYYLLNKPTSKIIELDQALQVINSFDQFKNILLTYPELSKSQLESILYSSTVLQNGRTTTRKFIKNKIFLIESKYNELKDSNQLEQYFQRKSKGLKEGSKRWLKSQLSYQPRLIPKQIIETNSEGNIIREFKSFKDVLLTYPEINRKGLEKVLYEKIQKSTKGKYFQFY